MKILNVLWKLFKWLLKLAFKLFVFLLQIALGLAEIILHHLNEYLKKINHK